ncbi:anti-sigma factor family protein [Actinopolyspora halophila]|uniref:anti-sigma factor family protein n=1 Tax=Actinopolyspora halophila TaxID=1850 RepID=UPI000378E4B2|nr:zf-HC2 domain-containing protein [Actinopolyspora halophila]
MTGLRGWGLPEQHLALDALVAFVDGELSPSAHDRAAAHLATCPSCAAEADSQRQARSAVRTASTPSVSPQLLQSLQSIPSTAELPEQPDNLALSEDGRLVTTNGRNAGAKSSPLGAKLPLGGGSSRPDSLDGEPTEADADQHHSKFGGRRAKQGAGVVFSGLVLGALAFMNTPADSVRNNVTTVPDQAPHGGAIEEAESSVSSTSPTPETMVASSPGSPVRTTPSDSGGTGVATPTAPESP